MNQSMCLKACTCTMPLPPNVGCAQPLNRLPLPLPHAPPLWQAWLAPLPHAPQCCPPCCPACSAAAPPPRCSSPRCQRCGPAPLGCRTSCPACVHAQCQRPSGPAPPPAAATGPRCSAAAPPGPAGRRTEWGKRGEQGGEACPDTQSGCMQHSMHANCEAAVRSMQGTLYVCAAQ